jgi:di/tricarboxylate transporter
MKQMINWFIGFFDSTNEKSSSKRLVGIIGAFSLFYTLLRHKIESDSVMNTLIWAIVLVICVSLGLASVKDFSGLIGKFKGDKTNDSESPSK